MKYIFRTVLLAVIFISAVSEDLFSQIYWNRSASFEGNSSSYVSVPNSSSINITGSFTIEAWINPSTLSGAAKGIVSKGGVLGSSLRFGIRLQSNGRLSLNTNGNLRLLSRALFPVPVNKWTHIAATYNVSTGVFRFFINGISDTSSTILSAAPSSNTDSLFIGISGSSTPFTGKIDEVRLWDTDLDDLEILDYYRSTLGASSGIYDNLVMSIPFQGENTFVNQLRDMSGNGNDAFIRNVLLTSPNGDLAGGNLYNPHHTISPNESLELDGTEDYLAGVSTSSVSPDSAITLECWVYPRTNSACRIISKGNSYAIIYTGNNFNALINGTVITSSKSIPVSQWSYLVFTYRSNGQYNFYVNSINVKSGTISPGNINVTADSLYIGGGPGSIGDLNGFLDEVRVTNGVKSQEEIHNYNYASLDHQHDPNILLKNVNYGFDGNAYDNISDGGPALLFRNNARFSHPGGNALFSNPPVSPLIQYSENSFSRSYYIKTSNKRIPEVSSMGTITDSVLINQNVAISDINLFLGINHTCSCDLDVLLIAPNGDSVIVIANQNTVSGESNLITIFDDQADSLLLNNNYASFYSKLKPANSMNSVFSGDNSKGYWKLRVRDEGVSNTGFLYAWGIQINNFDKRSKNLNISALIQGFYDPVSNTMIQDTLRVDIYANDFIKSDKALIEPDGMCYFNIQPSGLLTDGKDFLVQVRHRNSIETWSDKHFKFTNSEVYIDFLTTTDNVLGDNLAEVDDSPVRYAIFGGDFDQDGSVDLNDLIPVFNSASSFTSGYVLEDVTGNNLVDLTDVVLVFNNANNFVHSIIP